MRLFWTSVLVTGLLLVGLTTYESRQSPDAVVTTSARGEDGTGFPQPYPTPTPKP